MKIASEAIEGYTETYGVSAAEARARLVDQSRVIDLQGRLEQIDERVGLVWYDNQEGTWAIGAPEAADEAALGRELSRLGLGQRSELRPVASSAAAMRAAVAQGAEELRDLLSGGNAQFGLGAGTLDLTLSSDIDASDARRAEQRLREAIERETRRRGGPPGNGDGGQLKSRRSSRRSLGSPPATNCQFPYCDEMLGGILYHDPNSSCTTAFYVGSAAHPQVYEPFLLTAGHCITNYQSWYSKRVPNLNNVHGGHEMNGYVGVDSGYGGDGGLLSLTNNAQSPGGWSIQPRWWNWSTGQYSTVEYAYTEGSALVGTWMCKNGATSRSTCGEITSNTGTNEWPLGNYPETGPDSFVGMLRSTACLQRGDSGGPWTQANLQAAIGISSAVGGCGDGSTSIGEPLDRALRATGTVIYGYPPSTQ